MRREYKGYNVDTDDSGYAPAFAHWHAWIDGEPVKFVGATREEVEQQIDEAEIEHWLTVGPELLAAVQDLLYHLAPSTVPEHLKTAVNRVRAKANKVRAF